MKKITLHELLIHISGIITNTYACNEERNVIWECENYINHKEREVGFYFMIPNEEIGKIFTNKCLQNIKNENDEFEIFHQEDKIYVLFETFSIRVFIYYRIEPQETFDEFKKEMEEIIERDKKREESDDRFPILYMGKLYGEDECDDLFLVLYDGLEQDHLDENSALYHTEGYTVAPNGDWYDEHGELVIPLDDDLFDDDRSEN
jgi:hypothetical protein